MCATVERRLTVVYDVVRAAVSGDRPERTPRAVWRHWPGDDQAVDTFADVLIADQRRFDWDFVKVSPSSSHTVEPWGARTAYRADGMLGRIGEREYVRRVIGETADWATVGALGDLPDAWQRQVAVIERLASELPAVPRLVSVFSPISVLRYMCGDGLFLRTFRGEAAISQRVLGLIADATVCYVERLIAAGADGIFYSTLAAADTFDRNEYIEYAVPFDRAVMEPAADAWFNVLHLHGFTPHLDVAKLLPVSAVNWDTEGDVAALRQGQQYLEMCVLGGLDQHQLLVGGTPTHIADAMRELRTGFADSGHLIIGPGCASPIGMPIRNLRAVSSNSA